MYSRFSRIYVFHILQELLSIQILGNPGTTDTLGTPDIPGTPGTPGYPGTMYFRYSRVKTLYLIPQVLR